MKNFSNHIRKKLKLKLNFYIGIDFEARISQRLIQASHNEDVKWVKKLIADPLVDVNFIGTVSLKAKKSEIVLNHEAAHEVCIEYQEFKTKVTALFLAAHAGNLTLVRILLSVGADVNQKLFRGYATTAAVREGHLAILNVLIKAGASQEACEEALLEASYLGQVRSVELLMGSDLIRPQAAVHALVSACCRGFVEVVDTLIKCQVDANAIDRGLLQSSKPSLHDNVHCNALVAAVVSRQISVVKLLLQAGVKTNIKANLGAWSWDKDTRKEFQVGAGLAEAYYLTWLAVEYFEASGVILRLLFHHLYPNLPHYGRSLIHHAILCNNTRAVKVLLNCSVDKEFPIITSSKTELRPIHLAARLGFAKILQCLIDGGCDINSRTASGETALMICARYQHEECLKVLASEGADFGLVNSAGQCASSIAKSIRWTLGFQQAVIDVIRTGKTTKSSNASIFSPLMFVARAKDVQTLKKLIEQADIDLDEQYDDGFSAGDVVHSNADVKLQNKYGETTISLSESNMKGDVFEKVVLECALQVGYNSSDVLYALHRAARRVAFDLVHMLISEGYDVNAMGSDGYTDTSLMLAAMRGHSRVCELLISSGAKWEIENARHHETALSLARKNEYEHDFERVILDELAVTLVLNGTWVKKHTRCGKGSPHRKVLRMEMVDTDGVLRWGRSSKRNVICRAAEVGPSAKFRRNRRNKFDVEEAGMFHVVTTKNKEVHFVCQGGHGMAKLWVRGIKIVTTQVVFGEKH